MKDIKSLYLAAKNSGRKSDISAYTEAVHEMFENSPNDYITNLEYIIQSDIGIKTLNEFVERYGLPISCFDEVMECLETCVEKCSKAGLDSTLYQEAADYMKGYRQKYIGCFMMESFFNDQCPRNHYINTYYGTNVNGFPNRKLPAGLLEKFQEYAIPDIIVTADMTGGNAMNTVLSYIESHTMYGNPATCEWVLECVKNIVPEENHLRSMLESKASSGILKSLRERNHQCYREAVITGNDDMMLEYSEDELQAIHDLISINEYKMTWADELNESATDIQNTIYSLYEEFDGLLDEDGVMVTESYNSANTAANKIASNLGKMRKTILKLVRPVVRDMVKRHNKDSGFFSQIQYPAIGIIVKDKRDRDKMFVKHAIKKNLNKIANSDKKFIDTVHLAIEFRIDSGSKKYEKKSIDLFTNALLEALGPLVGAGEITFNKSDNYYVSITYWQIPIYLSKNCLLDGVDLDFDEAGIDLEEFVADSVIPMLPGANGVVQPMEERPWLVNTRNKKTGDIPGYIKRNHNLGYGEDDGDSDHGATGSSSDNTAVDPEPTLDDFKRPSAEDMSTPYAGLDEPKEEPEKEAEALTPAEQRAVNNYYYYTYNNSLNKNTTGSFNRDHSTHTSTSTKKTVDDHSKNKRVNSDNNNVSSEDEDEFKPVGEKVRYPWEIDIFAGSETLYAESSKLDKTKLEAFINKRKKNRKRPDIKVINGYPITRDGYTDILKRIDAANDQLKDIIKKYDDKYPIYGLKVVYDKSIQSYGLGDGFEGLGVRKVKNYSMFEDLGDEYIFDIGYLLLSAFKVTEFVNNLKDKYPDEHRKLQSEFDKNPAKDPEDTPDPEDTTDLVDVSESANHADEKDDPVDWSNAMNSYKFLDYDKNLMEIWAYIGMDVLKEIKGSLNYDYWSGEGYAWYGFYIAAKTLYPEFNEKEIQRLKVPTVSNFAKKLSKEMKAIYFKEAGPEDSYNEEVGDADKDRPQSDHPVKDILTDVDRALVKKQQGAKRVVQNAQNVGRAFMKPAVRTTKWVDNMVHNWKDADENSVKEKLADPHARSNLFSAIRTAIVGGSLLKAGLLLNPVFLGLSAARGIGKNKREFRIRNEMIGELKTEMQIIDEKIKDADRVGDNKAKYKLMRFKNELNKKLLRVGGPKGWKKMI